MITRRTRAHLLKERRCKISNSISRFSNSKGESRAVWRWHRKASRLKSEWYMIRRWEWDHLRNSKETIRLRMIKQSKSLPSNERSLFHSTRFYKMYQICQAYPKERIGLAGLVRLLRISNSFQIIQITCLVEMIPRIQFGTIDLAAISSLVQRIHLDCSWT